MSEWIRKKSNSGLRRVIFYVNEETDLLITQWLDSFPFGKAGDGVRKAVRFYLEHNLNSGVAPENASRTRRKAPAKSAKPEASMAYPPATDPNPRLKPPASMAFESGEATSMSVAPVPSIEMSVPSKPTTNPSRVDILQPEIPASSQHAVTPNPVNSTLASVLSESAGSLPDPENTSALEDLGSENLRALTSLYSQFND